MLGGGNRHSWRMVSRWWRGWRVERILLCPEGQRLLHKHCSVIHIQQNQLFKLWNSVAAATSASVGALLWTRIQQQVGSYLVWIAPSLSLQMVIPATFVVYFKIIRLTQWRLVPRKSIRHYGSLEFCNNSLWSSGEKARVSKTYTVSSETMTSLAILEK